MRRLTAYLRLSLVPAFILSAQDGDRIVDIFAGAFWKYPADPLPALEAPISNDVYGMAVDKRGNLLIADTDGGMILRLNSNGILQRVAGTGLQSDSGVGGPAELASIQYPHDVAVDDDNTVYFSTYYAIYKISAQGVLIRIPCGGCSNFVDGITVRNGTIYAWDHMYDYQTYKSRPGIIKIDASGRETRIVATGEPGFAGDGGPAVNAKIGAAGDIAVDSGGNIYLLDPENRRVRKIDTAGRITTVLENSFRGRRFGDFGDRIYLRRDDGSICTKDGQPVRSSRLDFDPFAVGPNDEIYVNQFGILSFLNANDTLRTVAGKRNAFRFLQEGGPATSAYLHYSEFRTGYRSALVFQQDNLFLADTWNYRVRKVDGRGIISTVAGDGEYPGSPAASSRSIGTPYALAADSSGNVYFNDGDKVRKIAPNGTVTLFAGGGQSAPTDGSQALNVALPTVNALAVDNLGNVYVAERALIRKIDRNGVITRVAGTGAASVGADGDALTSTLAEIGGMTTDLAGNLYFTEIWEGRVRKLSNGRIVSLAGGAKFGSPSGLAIDNTRGTVYVATGYSGRSVQAILSSGAVVTVTGFQVPPFSAQGRFAKDVYVSPGGLAIDPRGNLYVADDYNHVILRLNSPAAAPSLNVDRTRLDFSGPAGSPIEPRGIALTTSTPRMAYSVSTRYLSGANWLQVPVPNGETPATIAIGVRSAGLAPGTYTAEMTIRVPGASPESVTAVVSLRVDAELPPRLALEPPALLVTRSIGSGTSGTTVNVLNAGGGSINYSSAIADNASWLKIGAGTGIASASSPGSISLDISATGLGVGAYTSAVTISGATASGPISPVKLPVTLNVIDNRPRILLSQTGLSFRSVAGGGAPSAQRFFILNEGQGVLQWSARASTVTGGNWLSLDTTAGRVERPLLDASAVEVAINPASVSAGKHYGTIQLSGNAANSPQSLTVILEVLPAGSNPGPEINPTGMVFIARPGSNPGAQEITVTNLTRSEVSFISGKISEGGEWISHAPNAARSLPSTPSKVVVQPNLSNLSPGVRRGVITFLFLDGTPSKTVDLLTVVPDPAALDRTSKDGSRQAGACPLTITPTTLRPPFAIRRGEPLDISAKIVNCKGEPLLGAAGTTGSFVLATFSNRDNPLGLVHTKDGLWTGTWKPVNIAQNVTIKLIAGSLASTDTGALDVGGSVSPETTTPLVPESALLNAANFKIGAPLAPGSLVTLFGANISNANASTSFPWPTTLQGTQITLGGRALPLLNTSTTGQVSAQIPFDMPVGEKTPAVVQRGNELSLPENFLIAAAQPGIFALNQAGTGQGIIVKSDQVTLARPESPAQRNEVIVIYATGLGQVDRAVAAGTPAPSTPLARTVNPVTVRIGGVIAEVLFSGLTPGYAGLYQVNVRIPPNAPTGDAVNVEIEVARQSSPPVTIAIR